MSLHSPDGHMRTFTGRVFCPFNPRAQDVCLEDIAHALSLQCRFAGHIHTFYSTAQHSVLVSHCCNSLDALWGLLHDGAEAYVSDVIRPVKDHPMLAGYRTVERAVQAVIVEAFGLAADQPRSVNLADDQVLDDELRDLYTIQQPLPPGEIRILPLAPAEAEDVFLARYRAIREARR